MDSKKITIKDLLKDFAKKLEEASQLDYFVRDKELQVKKIEELKFYLDNIHKYKKNVQLQNEEILANNFFAYQCLFNVFISSLSMWVQLKENETYKSWDSLIDAQEYIIYAQKVFPDDQTLNTLKDKYLNIEKTIFPGFPLYSSLGLLIRGGDCSICGKPIESCSHIENELYCGSICKRVNIKELELDHSAIVQNPKDKRCVIRSFEFEPGMMFDYMSLKFLEYKAMPEEGTLGRVEMVLFNNNELDIF